MRKLLMAATVAVALAQGVQAQANHTPPKIDAVKWYNTPPLALEQLQEKAVLVEVFRTW